VLWRKGFGGIRGKMVDKRRWSLRPLWFAESVPCPVLLLFVRGDIRVLAKGDWGERRRIRMLGGAFRGVCGVRESWHGARIAMRASQNQGRLRHLQNWGREIIDNGRWWWCGSKGRRMIGDGVVASLCPLARCRSRLKQISRLFPKQAKP